MAHVLLDETHMGAAMMLLGVAVIVLVGIVAWRVLGSSAGSSVGPPSGESPEEILKCRYARGEIDDAEFEHRMSALHH